MLYNQEVSKAIRRASLSGTGGAGGGVSPVPALTPQPTSASAFVESTTAANAATAAASQTTAESVVEVESTVHHPPTTGTGIASGLSAGAGAVTGGDFVTPDNNKGKPRGNKTKLKPAVIGKGNTAHFDDFELTPERETVPGNKLPPALNKNQRNLPASKTNNQ